MTAPRLAVALALVVLAATVGVGAATPGATDASAARLAANDTAPLGESISAVMQASAAQAAGAVETGMWAAAYANASNASEKRALVQQRVGQLNGTLAELQAERAALREAYRNGSIDRAAYRAQLSALVGRLAAVGEAIEAADERGQAVGVNATRLDELRSQARELGGAEVSRLARNLTGGQGPPGPAGLFQEGPGGTGGGPPEDRGNTTRGGGPPTEDGAAGNATTTRAGDDG